MPRIIDLTDAILALNGGINDDVSYDPLEQLTLFAGVSETMKLAPTWTATLQQWYDLIALSDGAQAYWKFDEGAGATTAFDSAHVGGTFVNLSPTGGVTVNQAGVMPAPDAAVLLNGTTGYYSSPFSPLFNLKINWTLEAWVKLASLPGAGASACIISETSATPSYQWLVNPSGTVSFVVGATTYATTTGALAVGAWKHVVLTYDNSTLRHYLNGVADTAQAVAALAPGGLAINIGAGPSAQFLSGTVDEVAVYSSTLSATKVANHYAVGISASVLQSTWGGSFKWGKAQWS